MTYITNKDFLIDVQKGNVAGHSLVHKFGRNDGVPNGSFEFVNLLGFTAWPLSAATTVRVKSGGNVNDTAAGTGAQAITVQGIDSTLAESSESVATAGAGVSAATSASFWRIHRAYVTPASSGTYGGANIGAVTIENSSGGTDLIQIATQEGQSQFAGFTIPNNKTGFLLSVQISVDASKAADIRMYQRADITTTTPPVEPKRLKIYWDGVTGNVVFTPRSPLGAIAESTDIWFEAQGSGAGTEVAVDFELLLVDD